MRYVAVLAVFAAILLTAGGCTADPNAVSQMFPLLPAALANEPPPSVELMALPEESAAPGETVAEETTAGEATVVEEAATAEEAAAEAEEAVAAEEVAVAEEVAAEAQVAEQEVVAESATEQEIVAVEESPLPTPAPTSNAVATVRNRRVNIRSGPGLDFSVFTVADQGTEFPVVGKNEQSTWWQICCVKGENDAEGEATQVAWVSDVVVNVSGEIDQVPVIGSLLPDDMEAHWNVAYQCKSGRCEVPECTATISAEVRNATNPRWLEVDRSVAWENNCGENSTWLHQLDRLSGADRYGNNPNFFLFNYWAGKEPGPINAVFTMPDGRKVSTWCSDELTTEIEEGGGWTTIYDGKTCHDIRTGLLLSMRYSKRWVFTGTFEGQKYERAYFGDEEIYEISLQDTTLELQFQEVSE